VILRIHLWWTHFTDLPARSGDCGAEKVGRASGHQLPDYFRKVFGLDEVLKAPIRQRPLGNGSVGGTPDHDQDALVTQSGRVSIAKCSLSFV
jgi:hypothetical protein